jgi:two-component system KDP operon response regulator KdpE
LAPAILVVEDDPRMRRFLRDALANEQFRVMDAHTGRDALIQAGMHNPDLVVLDVGLPDIDGLEVTKKLREWTATPIVIVSARQTDSEKVAAFEAGANDYVTKPFSTAILLARIRVWLREAQRATGMSPGTVIEVGGIAIDLARRVAFLDRNEVRLSLTEYKLLSFMMRNAGKVLTHQQILSAVWGPKYARETQYLRVYMGHIRQKFEQDPARPRYFLTELAIGYRLRTSE